MSALPEEPQPAGVPAPAASPAWRSATADIALVSTFAAFLAVCSVLPAIVLPGMVVPITLQTFAVMLAGLVLGPLRGALAVLLYLAVGLAGLPVFAQGTGGLAVLGRPSLGYLLAFPLAAALSGYLLGRFRSVRPRLLPVVAFASATTASLLLIHPLGITVMGARLGLSAGEAIAAGAVFLPGDVIKNLLAATVATIVLRAFPEMLHQRR